MKENDLALGLEVFSDFEKITAGEIEDEQEVVFLGIILGEIIQTKITGEEIKRQAPIYEELGQELRVMSRGGVVVACAIPFGQKDVKYQWGD